MGINGKTHSPLGPQQTREWKNKRSTAWKRQDVRLGEDRPPGNQLKPNQFAKTQQEKEPTTLGSNSISAKQNK